MAYRGFNNDTNGLASITQKALYIRQTLTKALPHYLPLDTFVDAQIFRMEVVGGRDKLVPAHIAMQNEADTGPYGCFILRMGVISMPS